jgi:hypothetical protein
MSYRQQWIWCAIATALLGVSATLAGTPLGTAFTYQGQLKEDGVPVNDPARSMWFRLYDTSLGGFPVGGMLPAGVRIDKGLFTVQLDFGINAFDGNKRWLEIDVLKPGVGYFTLTPRQEITATPYAAYAPRATYADDADTLDGQHGSFYQDASNLTTGTLSKDRLPQNAIDSSKIENETILDEDISPTAAIAPSKINGTALTYATDGYPPRAGYNAPSGFMTTSDTYQIVTSVTINLPTGGYVFALASAFAGYWTGPYEGAFALGFGSTTEDQPTERWVKMPNADHEQSVSTATMHWMEAGSQTVYLLIKRDSGTGPIWFPRSTLSVIFFDDLSKVQALNAATREPESLHRPVDGVRQ